ncbi:hypothetical protein MPSEU_000894600 [Mayamaea pseudoterrestris]|nr:hypothetical protein MPSEU_000894600 [Mayamaea pseudoterrestris]
MMPPNDGELTDQEEKPKQLEPRSATIAPSRAIAYTSLEHIDQSLRIKILHCDPSIVVIDKPGRLRSVPGHARNNDFDPTLPTGPRKRPREKKFDNDGLLPGQKAWTAAIQSLGNETALPAPRDLCDECITRLGGIPSLVASTPRKLDVFCRYIHRNRQRLMDNSNNYSEGLAKDMFKKIQEKYRSFLPEKTKLEDSALGQIRLLGLYRTDQNQATGAEQDDLYIVHRLDCDTSGVMVFARTQVAASELARDWRLRNVIRKSYLAHVRHWPPFHKNEELFGSIDLPLKPSEERLKWRVCAEADEGARVSKTLWRVLSPKAGPLELELTPITGRTHQLRIHCSEIGSGITGDALYSGQANLNGLDIVALDGPIAGPLCLHAHRLSFPHPESGLVVEFVAEPPSWFRDAGASTVHAK